MLGTFLVAHPSAVRVGFWVAVAVLALAAGVLLSLVAAALLSVAAETAQALLPVQGRACDTNDVAMNVVGAASAALAAAVGEAVVRAFCRVPRYRSGVASRT